MDEDPLYRTPQRWLNVVNGVAFLASVAICFHSGFLKAFLAYVACIIIGIIICRIIKP